jgi:hypothetical protein
VKLAGLSLGATAILALLERGKIARKYGQIAVYKALGIPINREKIEDLPRKGPCDLFRNILQPQEALRRHSRKPWS